ncbi:MAG TPA: DUF1206 domain-containing protein [Streptosporangiaceae bacterium]|nr:DUF1206 domain-containing protein [Streptosporangiaceae bacterium]
MKLLGRAGFAARGVLYVVIGWIAIEIALGQGGTSADNRGALEAVGSTPVGSVLIWLLGIGFAGLALWRLAQAAAGGPTADEHKLTARLAAVGKAAVYGFLSYETFRYAIGSGAPKASDRQSVDATATLMRYPGGQAVVIIVGFVLIGAGIYLAWQAWRRKFLRSLETGRLTATQRRFAIALGEVGGIARGVVFAAAGVFLVIAGAQHNPGQAKGLDATLRSFAHTPAGPFLLVVVAAGLIAFGGYSCLEAGWRRV